MQTMRELRFFSITILLCFIFPASCRNNEVVAKIEGDKIRARGFVAFCADRLSKHLSDATIEEKLKVLNAMIDEKIMLEEAQNQGYDQHEYILKRTKEFLDNLLIQYTLEKEVEDQVVSSSCLKRYYKKMKKKVAVQYAHLPASFFNESDSVETVKMLQEIRGILLRGGDFNSILSQWNQKVASLTFTKTPVMLSWSEKNYPNCLYEAAYQLRKGQVSNPVKNVDGYYLVYASDVRPVKLPPFKKMQGMIKENCKIEMQKDTESSYYQFLNRLKKRYQATADFATTTVTETDNADSLIAKWAYEKKYYKNAAIRNKLRNFKESIILKKFEKETFHVDRNSSPPSLITPLNVTAEMVDVREIYVDDHLLAERIVERARNGENFDQLAAQYNESSNSSVKRYYISASADQSTIAGLASKLKPNEVSHSINKNGRYTIFKVLRKSSTDQKSQVQEGGEIAAVYKNDRARVKAQWLQSMRNRKNIIIDENALQTL